MLRTLLAVVLFIGCGGKAKPAEPEPMSNTQIEATPAAAPVLHPDDVIGQMQRFMDQMCECPNGDASCAKAVSDRMTTWAEEQARKPETPRKLTDEEMRRATDIGTRMGECMQAAMSQP